MAEYILDLTAFDGETLDDGLREEIVRCRDCRFYWSFRDKFDKTCHAITNVQIYTNPDEFCSRGVKRVERKESGE